MLYALCLFHFQICTVYVSALKYNSAPKIKDLWTAEYEHHLSSFFFLFPESYITRFVQKERKYE